MNNMNNSDLTRRSTAPMIFDENNSELVYSAPNTVKTNKSNYLSL